MSRPLAANTGYCMMFRWDNGHGTIVPGAPNGLTYALASTGSYVCILYLSRKRNWAAERLSLSRISLYTYGCLGDNKGDTNLHICEECINLLWSEIPNMDRFNIYLLCENRPPNYILLRCDWKIILFFWPISIGCSELSLTGDAKKGEFLKWYI